ncbi:unnamed protein product [Cylicocyclus nassatus]|uniref:Uncharacterized protein n=1 Tax=Cylicocyclus nassatus TaxID=53992 RepID=A0AA36GR17_CYLNA|nr:unnamed protein product [Cylicocyclus nassatus]
MDRKDIEDFLKRSNSICDQTSTELDEVNVRRMSLKEFTGLNDTKEEMTELPIPSWKSSTTPSSLISSYSARRRSVLAAELPESPTRKLTAPREESVDLPTAIRRVERLQARLQEAHASANPSSNSTQADDQHKLLEESKRMVVAANEFSQIKCSVPESKWSTAIAEVTDCADCLTTAAQQAICSSSVYYSQLFSTEVTQVLQALHDALNALEEARTKNDDSISLKPMTNLISRTNQLLHASSTTSSTTT